MTFILLCAKILSKDGDKMSKICCFTGHRSISLQSAQIINLKLENTLVNLIENEGFTDFRAGGAVGFDSIAALAVIKLKKKYPNIKLHLILPHKGQDKYFPALEKDVYRFVVDSADSVTYIQNAYSDGVMFARNRALVDGSDLCIACLERLSGGTYQTVNYARKNKVKTINLLRS